MRISPKVVSCCHISSLVIASGSLLIFSAITAIQMTANYCSKNPLASSDEPSLSLFECDPTQEITPVLPYMVATALSIFTVATLSGLLLLPSRH